MLSNLFHHVLRFPREAFFWAAALLALVCYYPQHSHFTLCPLSHLGFTFCPGCGLGRSISYLFHGEILRSFETHPLGMFAVIVLSFRIVQLSKHYLKSHGKSN